MWGTVGVLFKDLHGVGCYDECLLQLKALGRGGLQLRSQICVLGTQSRHLTLVCSLELRYFVVQYSKLGIVSENGRRLYEILYGRAHHVPTTNSLIFGYAQKR